MQPTNDDARLAKIRERHGRGCDDCDYCFLLRLLDEARADERKKLVAMLREPSIAEFLDEVAARGDLEPAFLDHYKEIACRYAKCFADLLERAP